ncbi:hypothetical protein CTRI78_v003647 [Colletotrichum trifolii]|uniref:Uncharacterized protein n=1 Tax=Colletotrichum trifolii TaxID=5466 RepID=A0A4R8RIW8_COLTR|nr:hypothetical protein CTRI78_v003647 [Colletotrichum trifolii]
MQVTIHRGHKAESLRETTLRARKQIIKQSVLDDASSDKCSRPISSEEISTVIAFISRADIEEASQGSMPHRFAAAIRTASARCGRLTSLALQQSSLYPI